MGAQRHEVGGEGAIRTHQRFDGHCCRDVRRTQQDVEISEGQDEHPEHPIGAVDQGQPLLGLQRDRCDAGRRRVGSTLTFSEKGKSNVGERGEITARPERSVFRHGRGDPGVE